MLQETGKTEDWVQRKTYHMRGTGVGTRMRPKPYDDMVAQIISANPALVYGLVYDQVGTLMKPVSGKSHYRNPDNRSAIEN